MDILRDAKMLQLRDDKVPIDYTMPINWTQFTDN